MMMQRENEEKKSQELVPLSNPKETDGDDEEATDRGQWSLQIEYLLSVIGFCVGLGNVWRFPYICSRNGGGAFLIPFLICLVVCGLPLFFLEVAIGQFSARSMVHVWSLCPIMKGVGIGTMIISVLCPLYYTMIASWALFYTIASCNAILPWTSCNNTWNTDSCVTSIKMLHPTSGGDVNQTAYDTVASNNYSWSGWENQSLSHTAAEEFLQYKALDITDGLHNLGHIRWELAICHLAFWIVLFLCLVKGVKSVGKAVYVTATMPYVILTILLVRGLTLPGGPNGALFYITPNFSKLLEIQVWLEACLQVFYSLGPAWGALITMASYNKFHSNCLRNALLCTFISEGTSLFAGLVVFSILGFMAQEANIPITKIVSSGPGLGFVIYPEALAQLPLPQLWSFIFFIMLILLAMDSMFSQIEAVICVILDEFPFLRKWRVPVTAGYCVASFLIGLIFTTQGGMYVFQLIDWYTAAVFPILTGLLECVVIGWVYGIRRFSIDIKMMIGREPPVFFKLTWCYITPIMLAITATVTLAQYQPPTYGNYVYPDYAASIGWFIAAIPLIPVVPVTVWIIYREEGTLLQRLRRTLSPDASWCPAKRSYRELYREKCGDSVRGSHSLRETCIATVSCKS